MGVHTHAHAHAGVNTGTYIRVSKHKTALVLFYFHAQFLKLTYLYAAFCFTNCLIGLVVKVSASRAEDPGFESHLRQGVES